MSGLRIDLSAHTDKFIDSSRELLIDKNINFIFGKNGTGKTTITDEILEQFSDQYNVCVFKDFDGIAENNRLNAVALGTENAKIQQQIDAIDRDIKNIRKDVEVPVEKATQNLFTRAEKAKADFNKHEAAINKFYRDAAQQIKNINNPTVAVPSYNLNHFRDEISKANKLTDEEIAAHKNIIKADKKDDIKSTTFPSIDLGSFLSSTNEVLASSVTRPQSIPELQDSPEKQQFAKQGMDIHVHEAGEVCAFCGHEIDEARWVALGNYFNNEVKLLEDRIRNGVGRLTSEIEAIDALNEIDKNLFYEKFGDKAQALNTRLRLKKSEHRGFLNKLRTALDKKKLVLFTASDVLEIDIPEDFSILREDYDSLVNENNKFSNNLLAEQEKSRNSLRYHVVKGHLDTSKYDDKIAKREVLRGHNEETQTNLKAKREELVAKQKDRVALTLQTKDEAKIATMINELLTGMGVASFSLKPITDNDEDQKGQYQILGHDGRTRPVTDLSRGEKNIIAFLYFLFSLEESNGDDRQKIIILDDPMTSNDDTMQYLMIGETQKFYRDVKGEAYFLLFTHNTHFYLNVRPPIRPHRYKENGEEKEISFYEKYGVFHLMSGGKRTAIKSITKGKEDFSTSYETLWKELVFLYSASDATPDLMLSACRKICETYTHFIKKDSAVFYGNNLNAKKLFDVNQHAIDDFEAEQNGKTKEEIRDILCELFRQNNAEDHFKSYWKGN